MELEQQVITLQSPQTTVQHNNTLLTSAGGRERHICTLDSGENTSTGAGEEQSTRGEDQIAGREVEGDGV